MGTISEGSDKFFRLSPDSGVYAAYRGTARQRLDTEFHSPRFVALRQRIAESKAHAPISHIIADPLVSGFAAGKGGQDDDDPNAIPQIRPTNILADGSITFTGAKNIPPTDVAPSDLIRMGEVLFNNTNSSAWVGKSAVFSFDIPAVCSNHVTRLRTKEAFEARLIAESLNTLQRLGYFSALATNFNNQAGVNAEALADVVLPLGAPEERATLLSNLDAARTARDVGLAAAEATLDGLDAFILGALGLTLPPARDDAPFAINRSLLQKGGKIFPNYYSPDRRHAVAELQRAGADLLGSLVDFVREQRTISPDDTTYVGLANIRPNTGEYIDAEEDVGGMVSVFEKGDVLFAKLRPYLNKVWVADRPGVCSPEFHVLRLPSGGRVESPDYLAAVLRASPTLTQTVRMMTGNTHPRLAPEDVVELVIPVPPPAVQKTIAAEVDRRRTEAQRLRAEAREGWAAARQAFEDALLGPAV